MEHLFHHLASAVLFFKGKIYFCNVLRCILNSPHTVLTNYLK